MAGDKMLMGLDIGSSKIRCVIGSVNHDGQLMVDSICERPSEGVRNGSIVNIELTLKAISSVVNEAELQAGAELSEVIIGIGGENIVCVPSNGVAGIKGNGQEIKQEDVMRSLEVARSFELPPDREIIHTLAIAWDIWIPVMVDNAEAVTHLTEYPDMQIIRLVVSEKDKKLRMELDEAA